MNPFNFRAVCALALVAPLVGLDAYAQTVDDANEGLKLAKDPAITDGFQVSWWGRSGRTYFLQRSENLTGLWSYFPIIEFGQNAPLSYGFVNPSPLVFVRVTYLDQILTDPYNIDSDDDGLTNQQEFDAKTDPFKTDTDGDGMPDKWELDHGFDPRNPADAQTDANNNGVSNLDEYLEGTDPRLDFYQGVAPFITVIDGADQARQTGQFLPRPMRVRLTKADGTAWSGAPIRFTARADEGLLSVDASGSASLNPALTVNTDANGYAQVWLKCP